MNLKVDMEEKDLTSIVYLSGEIDAFTAPSLKESLLPLTVKEGWTVEVNLEKVNYMDSTGLGVFIGALKSAKEHGSKLRLVNLQDKIRRLFTITGLDQVIIIDSTVRGGNE